MAIKLPTPMSFLSVLILLIISVTGHAFFVQNHYTETPVVDRDKTDGGSPQLHRLTQRQKVMTSSTKLRSTTIDDTCMGNELGPNATTSAMTGTTDIETSSTNDDPDEKQKRRVKLQGKLLKQLRRTCQDYNMLEDGDHIMVCVSGGKDSATLLYLLLQLQKQLSTQSLPNLKYTVVHVDQKQPGYNGQPLIQWLENFGVKYEIIEEDTYSIVVERTPENKSYCTVCSRLRRGILYSKALELGCNKIVLGHHADDAMETLLLNMLHAGQMKAMPARYTSQRGNLAVMRPLMNCMEDDIAEYAELSGFPILPCNLCSNQANLQRPQVKLLLKTLRGLNPNAKQNILNAMGDVRPSHLLDQNLREACGMDPTTGEIEDDSSDGL